jgi:hypothetical protein
MDPCHVKPGDLDQLRAWLAKTEPPPALVALVEKLPVELAATIPEYVIEAANVLYRYRAAAKDQEEASDIMAAVLRLFAPYLRARC